MFKTRTGRAVPQRAASETTRQQILNSALTLFRERGFDAATMREIAGSAGLSLGSAYYYFKSKEEIVAAYYDFVQDEHQRRSREAFARSSDLKDRLSAALHSKIDFIGEDRALLRALFRYAGDPAHPLSWFGPATRDQREMSMAVFAEAIAGERLPDDVKHAAPTMLWALHMGTLLYFLYDSSPNHKRTRRLIDAAVTFTIDARRIVTSPLLRPIRRRVFAILTDAGLLPEAA